ncbi:MAG: hypothetical protein HXM17_02750 [Fusobacterium periodonticum]|jgi:hypothetical protein|uniref:hypothetical protein n=1 Tax=Fusobacterium pseudoperiodonticum TaxID=2663009 RepID=UPI001CB3F7E9|nr:hypothetical protein [Fusobacterium pseudoperiodonticum]MBF1213806.1 hypothetical protein [Fusobacterium periodonticum]
MENDKFFNIKGMAYGSKRLLLLKVIMWMGLIGGFGPKLIRFNGLFSVSTLVILVPLVVIGCLSLYTSYKDYVVFSEKGIIIDVENDKFIYPIVTPIWNPKLENVGEVKLSSIFGVSTRNRKGKFATYYYTTIQSTDIEKPLDYVFFNSGIRDRLCTLLATVNDLK